MGSLANHQFPTFGQTIADTHQGIILHSTGIRPAVHQARSMATQQNVLRVRHELQIQRMLQLVNMHSLVTQNSTSTNLANRDQVGSFVREVSTPLGITVSSLSRGVPGGRGVQETVSNANVNLSERPSELIFDRNGSLIDVWGESDPYTGVILDDRRNVIMRFNFNDQRDAKEFRSDLVNSNITFKPRIVIYKSFDLQKITNKIHIDWKKNVVIQYGYVFKESLAGGKMDCVDYFRSSTYKSSVFKWLNIIGNIAYNDYDAGNFLWGYIMRKFGFNYGTVKSSSETNGFFSGKRQNNVDEPWYRPDKMITPEGDSVEDQAAMRQGYYWEPEYDSYRYMTPVKDRHLYHYDH